MIITTKKWIYWKDEWGFWHKKAFTINATTIKKPAEQLTLF